MKSDEQAIIEAESMLSYLRDNIDVFGVAQDSSRPQLWWNSMCDGIQIYYPNNTFEFFMGEYWQGAISPVGFPKPIYHVFICNL